MMRNEKASESWRKAVCTLFFLLAVPAMVFAETVGVFFDAAAPQDSFAAGDVKAALEKKQFTVEMLPLTSLASYSNKKVVIALVSNTAVTGLMGGTVPTGLSEQGFALRTTTTPATSYWVLGFDHNGAMYGGLEIADNIKNSGFTGTYNLQQNPYVLRRGTKTNLALDKKTPTYFGAGGDNSSNNSGDAPHNSIKNAWDLNYWKEWFDEMARARFNMLSIWNVHPFPALGLNMPESFANVTLWDGTVIPMTLEQKVAFWKQVMAYGHSRGFEIYFVTWNIYTMPTSYGNSNSSSALKAYMRKAVRLMFETYPDLDGMGCAASENMGGLSPTDAAAWTAETYGNGVADYAKVNPGRKIRFFHRFLDMSAGLVNKKFVMLSGLPNVQLDMSYKYSVAHFFATPAPKWIYIKDGENTIKDLDSTNMKTFLELRNEDFFFLSWGDPRFIREVIAAFPKKGTDYTRYVCGFMFGSDGWTYTRDFTSKSAPFKGMLEVKREWFLYHCLGRLGYNPQTPNSVFINEMASRWPAVDAQTLFEAWTGASRGVPMASEIVMGQSSPGNDGTFWWDWQWYPELSGSSFKTISNFASAKPADSSTMCSIANSAANTCGGNTRTSYFIADSIELAAKNALTKIASLSTGGFADLALYQKNIMAHSYLSLYYAEKVRGATYNKAGNNANAQKAMGNAYCYWKNYLTLMDQLHTGASMQRTGSVSSWSNARLSNVLKEYTDLGGSGTPSCPPLIPVGIIPQTVEKKPNMAVRSLTGSAVFCVLPGNTSYAVKIFTIDGRNVAKVDGKSTVDGISKVSLGSRLSKGVYIVQLRLKGASLIKRVQIL